jgi:uncharacterized protein YciI
MEVIKKFSLWMLCLCCLSCGGENKPAVVTQSNLKPDTAKLLEELNAGGYQIFDYVDEQTGDTIIMQQYFMAFLKRGPNKSASKQEADSLQALHLGHLSRMYELGYADISGPFGDDGEIRGITIYNTPTQEMADSLAHLDPLVQLGILSIEIHPWWAAKGFPLR